MRFLFKLLVTKVLLRMIAPWAALIAGLGIAYLIDLLKRWGAIS